MLGNAWPAADADSFATKEVIGRFAGPDESFTRAKIRHFFGVETAEGGVGFLDMFEPGR